MSGIGSLSAATDCRQISPKSGLNDYIFRLNREMLRSEWLVGGSTHVIKDEGNTGMEEISSMDGLVDKAADSQSFIKNGQVGSNPLSNRKRLALRNHGHALQTAIFSYF